MPYFEFCFQAFLTILLFRKQALFKANIVISGSDTAILSSHHISLIFWMLANKYR